MSVVSSFVGLNGSRPAAAPADSRRRAKATLTLYAGAAEDLLHRSGLIVTPNLDHLRLLTLSRSFRRAYAQADVVMNDSRFLDRLALGGRVLCLPGSELAPWMLEAAAPGARVVVIGGDATVEAYLNRTYPRLAFTIIEPSMGYIRKRAERRRLAAATLLAAPDYVFVCTGAPQSELMAAQLKRAGCHATILCCGSAFHFLTGAKRRAPEAFRALGAEWLWRFVGEAHTRARYAADIGFLLVRLPAFLALRATGRADFGAYAVTAR